MDGIHDLERKVTRHSPKLTAVRQPTSGDSTHHASPADSLWFLDDATVFCRDVTYSHAHCYLADGFYQQWLATLARLEGGLASDAMLYLGHGEPGGLSLLADQRAYIEPFVMVIREHRDSDEATRTTAISKGCGLVPNDRLQVFDGI